MSIRDLVNLARRPSTLAAAPAAAVPTKERGYSGGHFMSGFGRSFGDEIDHNALWRPPQRYATARKMKGFGACEAAMDAITLSLLSRDLVVTPGSEDPEDVDIAAFIANDLNNLSNASLFDLRFEAIDAALWFGCAPYQKVFALDEGDGRYHLKKLAYRPAATVFRWETDEFGGPDGLVQLDNEGQEIPFTMDELLVFVHRRVGGDLTGTPLARRMYAAWYALQMYFKLGPAAFERNGMAIPWTISREGSDSEIAADEQILMGLRGGSMAYARFNEGTTKDHFGLLSPSGTMLDPMPMMEYLRAEIFLSTFTQQQVSGMNGVGSLAKSEVDVSMLMQLLTAISKMETDTLTRYLVKPWVRYNWGNIPESRMPKVEAPPPEIRDVVGFFTSLKTGAEAGVQWDAEAVRIKAHDELGIPLPEANAPTAQDGTSSDSNPADPGAAPTPKPATAAGVQPRELKSQIALDALGIAPNFARMATAYEQAEAKILAATSAVQKRQVANLLQRAAEIVKRRDPAAVAQTDVKYVDELAAQIQAVLDGLYADGQAEMADELAQQKVKAPPIAEARTTADKALIAATAATTAKLFADRVARAWANETLRQVRTPGGFDRGAMEALLNGLGDKALLDSARQDTTVAFGQGRDATGEAAIDAIDHYVVSAILDTNTCGPCAELDGQDIDPADAGEYAPNIVCEGGDRCRCVLVPVAARE